MQKFIISEFYEFKGTRKLIEEAERSNKPVIMTGILQKANTLNRNGRVYPLDILRREVQKYMEAVDEGRAIGECVPAGTQIFTVDGWRNIEDVEIGDVILTMDYENNLLQEHPVEDTIKKIYKDDMIHIYNDKNLDMMITKKHKVVLWDRNDNPYVLTGEELFDKIKDNDSRVSHSYIKNSANWIGETPEYFIIPDTDIKIDSMLWAAFLGIYLAEGHSSGTRGGRNDNKVCISQTKEDSKKIIVELLDKMPFNYSVSNNRQFIITNKELHKHLFPLGNSLTKKVPDYVKTWSVELLNELLKWMLIGDGYNRKDRSGKLMREYYTTSPKLAEDVFEIMMKLGSGANINTRIPKDRTYAGRKILAENSNVLYIVHEKTTKGIYLDTRFIHADLIPFDDYVYCVTVKNSTWLMKSNNKISWTHNCDHPDSAVISLANVSHKVIDMWWQGDILYGKVQITETPAGNILKGLLKSEVMLGISSRGVGSVKSKGNQDVVQEDFELIAFDFVSSPSTPGAYMFKESRQWGLTPLIGNTEIVTNITKEDVDREIDKYKKIKSILGNNYWSNF